MRFVLALAALGVIGAVHARMTALPTVLAATAHAPTGAASATGADGDDWELTFHDDFNGASLNKAVWRVRANESHCCPQELQLYVEDEVFVQGGDLVLRTRRRSARDGRGNHFNYTSGWVDTETLWAQRYGKFEVRARLPWRANVTALWPAHWLMPDPGQCEHHFHGDKARCCWPVGGEIDIMEMISPFPYAAGTYRRAQNAYVAAGTTCRCSLGAFTRRARVVTTPTSPTRTTATR